MKQSASNMNLVINHKYDPEEGKTLYWNEQINPVMGMVMLYADSIEEAEIEIRKTLENLNVDELIASELSRLKIILEVYKEHFDLKYPCTTEENDGRNMSDEDKEMWEWYNKDLVRYDELKQYIEQARK